MFNQTGTDRHLTFKIQFWLNSQRKASVNSALTNIKSIKLSMFACTGINIAIGFCMALSFRAHFVTVCVDVCV